jgi:predicted AAA+ superfamily ATPase
MTLQPHFANFSRRLVKTPKLYFLDTGLVCHLLGIREADQLRGHPLRGAIFENVVVAALTKVFANDAEAPRLRFWRDSHGAEVDVVLDFGGLRMPIEIKSGETPARSDYRGLSVFRDLASASGQQISEPYGILVYGGAESGDRWGHMLRPWWACSQGSRARRWGRAAAGWPTAWLEARAGRDRSAGAGRPDETPARAPARRPKE